MNHERENQEWTFESLIAENGIVFLDMAFRILLNREIDPTGYSYYNGRLNAGISKSEVIYQIARSSEGMAQRVNIRGLKKAIFYFRLSKLPVIRWFARYFFGVEGCDANSRQLRAINAKLSDIALLSDGKLSSVQDGWSVPQSNAWPRQSPKLKLNTTAAEEVAMYAFLKLAQ